MKRICLSLILVSAIYAVEGGNDVTLDTITVTGSTEQEAIKDKKVGETKKSAKTLEKQQVSDSRDLVKYETGVTVVETGRMGASGYSIRGVDENRVAITVDGLHQAETLSSQGFKEVFEGYGNFNNTRNSIEMENVRLATITKGADSIKTGSGALGGSVMFETKDARDYLIDRDWFYGFKAGFASRDEEKMRSHTLAAKVGWFDFLVVKTDREANELKNYGYDKYDDSVRGREREKADPYIIEKESTLVKIGFQPHEEHRFTFTNDDYKKRSRGNDYSYTLYPRSITNPSYFEEKLGERYTDDLSKRTNRGIAYENFTETLFWDSVKFSYSNQRIKQRARTEEYCRGDNCQEISNPIGLQPKGSKVVDRNGNDFTMSRELLPGEYTAQPTLTDSDGNKYRDFKYMNINEYQLDCSIYDCSGTMRLYKARPWGSGADDVLDLDLSQNNYTTSDSRGTHRFDITEETRNGKTYKKITQNTYSSWANRWYESSQYYQYQAVLPNSNGYLTRDWKERDLNTDTRQLDLDFNKDFDLFTTEHSLSYGLKYIKTDKSMVNRAGFDAANPQWWANTSPGADCDGVDKWDALRCPSNDPETSFLIPVESKNGVFHIADDVIVNNFFDLNLAYRYDKIRYEPEYIPGKTPKIPDDMVRGLFIPEVRVPNQPVEPRWWNYGPCSNSSCTDPTYLADLANYNTLLAQYQAALNANARNPEENIAYMTKPKEYKNSSYAVGLNFNPFEFLRIQTKYSKAFRAPTTDELYLAFRHPDFTIKPNVNLKPEIAKTKEVAFTFYKDQSFFTISKFRTDYEDFLDLEFQGTRRVNAGGGSNSALDFDMYQNVNRQKAKADGIEINSKLNLGDMTDKLGGFHIGYKFTKQKGKILTEQDGMVPMNAIQPKTSVYNVGYATKNDKFGADIYLTAASAKKAEDTYNMFWRNERQTGDPINGRMVTDYRAHWLSNSYKVIDLVAYAKPVKNLTFRLGFYNITDEKYLTWESARSIRSFGTTNMVRKSDSLGIARFYAPGRNFKLTFEFTF